MGAPPAVMMSPQSPVLSTFRKLTAMALLQHVAMVVLVVDEVDVDVRDVDVDVLVRDVEVELEVDVLEVLVRNVEDDVLVRDVEVELEVDVLEVLVRDVEVDVLVRDVEVELKVDVVVVGGGGTVELLVELVDVVPPDGDLQLFGAGESLRLSTPSSFLTFRPPNSAQ